MLLEANSEMNGSSSANPRLELRTSSTDLQAQPAESGRTLLDIRVSPLELRMRRASIGIPIAGIGVPCGRL